MYKGKEEEEENKKGNRKISSYSVTPLLCCALRLRFSLQPEQHMLHALPLSDPLLFLFLFILFFFVLFFFFFRLPPYPFESVKGACAVSGCCVSLITHRHYYVYNPMSMVLAPSFLFFPPIALVVVDERAGKQEMRERNL